MIVSGPAPARALRSLHLDADLVVVGGGLAGTCCAITAARAGCKVTLVQDRPVLGGNASSEVRLWVLGATSHMGNNNRWAREGGVIDELLVENMYRNPEGNPLIVDALLLEMVVREPNITLLLNTAVFDVNKRDADTISGVRAFCSQNSTLYEIAAPLFCDASGDGIIGFMSGAAFRMGAESRDEFGEKFAPSAEYGELLGHSLYFYSKDIGRPVTFVPPSFALTDINRIPRYRSFNTRDHGCRLWWIEYGGRLDTVHDTETIKWELWKVIYGVWNYIKNSGKFPDAANMTLEWVGHIPGKRESRRFEGDYMLRQQDVVEQHEHDDSVAFGGWSIDLHPADGVFSERPGCNQWHSKGIYEIPYRCLYSRNIRNLFLGGRLMSSTHVAFGSSRVMATCALAGQAIGMAASLCRRDGLLPRDLTAPERMAQLQLELSRQGQHIPRYRLRDPDDLARVARLTASSTLRLSSLPPGGPKLPLRQARGMMLPVRPGPMPTVRFFADVARSTELRAELRVSSKPKNHTPDLTLEERSLTLVPGNNQWIAMKFSASIPQAQYAFVILHANDAVEVHASERRLTGVLSVTHDSNPAVAKQAQQDPEEDIGVDAFEFWLPARRPGGHNLAIELDPPLDAFDVGNVVNGVARPTHEVNAWVASWSDGKPWLTLTWDEPQVIGRVELGFDVDFDHPMESVLMGHPERVMPFCVSQYALRDDAGNTVAERSGNHHARNTIRLAPPLTTRALTIELTRPSPLVPAALFEVRCYRA